MALTNKQPIYWKGPTGPKSPTGRATKLSKHQWMDLYRDLYALHFGHAKATPQNMIDHATIRLARINRTRPPDTDTPTDP